MISPFHLSLLQATPLTVCESVCVCILCMCVYCVCVVYVYCVCIHCMSCIGCLGRTDCSRMCACLPALCC